MVNLNLLPLNRVTPILVPLTGGVIVRCRVVVHTLSVIVHIYDGRKKRFRSRRFTSDTLASVDEFTSLLESIKQVDSSLQSFAIAYFLSAAAIETLPAKVLVELFYSYLPTPKEL